MDNFSQNFSPNNAGVHISAFLYMKNWLFVVIWKHHNALSALLYIFKNLVRWLKKENEKNHALTRKKVWLGCLEYRSLQ